MSFIDLPNEAWVRILSYAVQPSNRGDSLCFFELISNQWKDIVQGDSARGEWELACQQKFPGSNAHTRDDYLFLLTPTAQSAARVIQRAMCRFKKIQVQGRYWSFPEMELSLTPCCICGVRWSLSDERCEVSSCPFRRVLAASKFFVCEPCGNCQPDRAMGIFNCSHDRESFTACFKCAGECDGSVHERRFGYDDYCDDYDDDDYNDDYYVDYGY